MPTISDHPLRFQLANELHARPFPVLGSPGQVAFLAIKEPRDAVKRDRARDRAHLQALLSRYGGQQPTTEATHYFGEIGKYRLKWEQHTEFVTYTAFSDIAGQRPFDADLWDVFPDDWLAEAPGACITSAHIHIADAPPDDLRIAEAAHDWFVPESMAISRVLDDSAVVAGDFRIHASGHMRFAVFVSPDTDDRRIGRVVQRLCEVETYKAMAMLGLPRAREITRAMGPIDEGLSDLLTGMSGGIDRPEESLERLLHYAAELEALMAQSAFRFGATGAYEALVHQRIAVLREERFSGRQTFGEFMTRRFEPSMRTIKATERRLQQMTDRAFRAGDLLRTRVDVDRSAQNQELLGSMDRRAALQLRLQKTVEGLSVVAISYYAVNLVVYLLAAPAAEVGIGQTLLTGLAVLPTVAIVWLIVARIRREVD